MTEQRRILGLPVVVTEVAPSIDSPDDIVICPLSGLRVVYPITEETAEDTEEESQ